MFFKVISFLVIRRNNLCHLFSHYAHQEVGVRTQVINPDRIACRLVYVTLFMSIFRHITSSYTGHIICDSVALQLRHVDVLSSNGIITIDYAAALVLSVSMKSCR